MFDLGGVLIECGDFSKMLEWEDWTNDISEIVKKYYECEAVRDYQRGIISTKAFAQTIMTELKLNTSISRFLMEFRAVPRGFYPGAEELLRYLAGHYITACLSNTNELHWNKMCNSDKLKKYFKFTYPSHITHIVKPNPDAYKYVINSLHIAPSNIAFFDDREENVVVAKQSGMDAYLTKGFPQLCECLNELMII